MKKIKKILILVAIAAVISLSLVGCNKKSQKSAIEPSTKEQTSNKQPSDEHPSKGKHPMNIHLTKLLRMKKHPKNTLHLNIQRTPPANIRLIKTNLKSFPNPKVSSRFDCA